MIQIPFKVTKKSSISSALGEYLARNYSEEEVERQRQSINTIQQLRNDAVSVEQPNAKAKQTLLKYYNAIETIQHRIPASETEAALYFEWNDVLRPKRSIGQFSWEFERANILFNIAAWETQSALQQDRGTAEGTKEAAKHFAAAATLFEHLKEEVANRLLGKVPFDLTPEGLSLLSFLMLAQGQACYYERASATRLQNAARAKLATSAAQLYRAAHQSVTDNNMIIINKYFNWTANLLFQASCFDAAAYFQQSKVAFQKAEEETIGYGDEIAYLDLAEKSIKKAIQNGSPCGIACESAKRLASTVQERKRQAIEDNNKIYMSPIPEVSELAGIQAAQMAKIGALPDLGGEKMELFSSLVPVEISGACTEFQKQLQDTARSLRERANEEAQLARAQLASVGLPSALSVTEVSSGLPEQLWNKIEAVHVSGGIRELKHQLNSNYDFQKQSSQKIQLVEDTLQEEIDEDNKYREIYGEQWDCAPADYIASSQKDELERYKRVLGEASSADERVSKKLSEHESSIAFLDKSKTEITASIPASGGAENMTSEAKKIRDDTRTTIDQLDKLLRETEKTIDATIAKHVTAESVAKLFMEKGVAAKDDTIKELSIELDKAQAEIEENVFQRMSMLLEKAMTQFERFSELKGTDPSLRARTESLQHIQEGIDKFEEIRSNLREGRTFYSDFRVRVDMLVRNVFDLKTARTMQRNELLLNLKQAEIVHPDMSRQVEEDERLARQMSGMEVSGNYGNSSPVASSSYYPSNENQPTPSYASSAAAPPSEGYTYPRSDNLSDTTKSPTNSNIPRAGPPPAPPARQAIRKFIYHPADLPSQYNYQ